mmetsp:Transcript_17024/g.48902  ORF Transcript_17024/g.48902 Transcript_17024/m.48902 type:complete len:243 (-) Transcript_17024:194-922(-)
MGHVQRPRHHVDVPRGLVVQSGHFGVEHVLRDAHGFYVPQRHCLQSGHLGLGRVQGQGVHQPVRRGQILRCRPISVGHLLGRGHVVRVRQRQGLQLRPIGMGHGQGQGHAANVHRRVVLQLRHIGLEHHPRRTDERHVPRGGVLLGIALLGHERRQRRGGHLRRGAAAGVRGQRGRVRYVLRKRRRQLRPLVRCRCPDPFGLAGLSGDPVPVLLSRCLVHGPGVKEKRACALFFLSLPFGDF